MTTKNEKLNIEKDILKAKASCVIVACKDKKVEDQVGKIVTEMPEDLSSKTLVCLIGDLLKVRLDEFVEGVLGEKN